MTTEASADSVSPWTSAYRSGSPRTEQVEVDGVTLAVSVWEGGRPDGAELLLVHGGAAHRGWWDHLVGLLPGTARVVALDLSGHGDSDQREEYSLDGWSDEVAGVAARLCEGRAVLVGHSMGGLVAVNAAQRNAERYSAVLALDSPLRRTASSYAERRRKIASRPVRSFASRREAFEQFKTFPPVTDAPPEVMAHIIEAAFRPSGERWELKFDPRIYHRPQVSDDFVREARVPTWWVRAENGFVDDTMAKRIEGSIGPLGRLVWVPRASHHLVLEQPLAAAWLVSAFLQAVGSSRT